MAQLKQFWTAGGVQKVAVDPQQAGPNGWILNFQASSDWVGSFVLAYNAQPSNVVPSGTPTAAQLTNATWVDYPSAVLGITASAGAPIFVPKSGTKTVIVGVPIFPLYAVVTYTAGSMTVNGISYVAPNTSSQTALLSMLTLDTVPVYYPDDLTLALQFAKDNQPATLP